MRNIIDYMKRIMSDNQGEPSSKRWIALVAFIMVGVTWGFDLFEKMTSTEYIFNALVFLIVGCLGITGAEKFAPKE